MPAEAAFSIEVCGPFDLSHQARYFGGIPTLDADPGAYVLVFPVERAGGAAAVVLRQDEPGVVAGRVYGSCPEPGAAWQQAVASLSLDEDGTGWPGVGVRDPVIARLQERYRFIRPTLFLSPYEAAAGFIAGHRFSIRQRRALLQRMAEALGERVDVGAQAFHAFPVPAALADLRSFRGLTEEKVVRLRGIGRAAAAGTLDRARLRALPAEQALDELQALKGVGPFFAEGILHRGAGSVDALPGDDLTPHAVSAAFRVDTVPGHREIETVAERWRPYRMWTVVLLHLWFRREVGVGPRGKR